MWSRSLLCLLCLTLSALPTPVTILHLPSLLSLTLSYSTDNSLFTMASSLPLFHWVVLQLPRPLRLPELPNLLPQSPLQKL